ncbi:RNA polymerase sigma factor [Agaribacter flavus]|uniref:RNA polymerase sigma factor n=1 Tax=Agaribacter flavus TaxID=1902781 RepID=A0ABV7FS81_9ALTE
MSVVGNDNRFWATLIQSHDDSLREFLNRRNQNAADVGDIIQETYMRVVKIPPQSVNNPQAYLFKTAANLSINNYKKVCSDENNKKNIASKPSTSTQYNTVTSTTPELELEAQRKRELMLEALKGLPQNCRAAFILHRFYPDTYLDIAKKLNVSVSMVEKYIAQAVLHCKQSMEQN